jgi:prepilin peptidase CpaA
MIELATAATLCVFPAVLIAAGLKDATSMTIPNWTSIALIVAFIPAALLVGLTPVEFAVHLAVGFALLVVGAILFAFRIVGGGDAKILAVSALWMGWGAGPEFLLWTCVAGGLFTLALINVRKAASPYADMAGGWVAQLLRPDGDIPYGVAIAIGALAAFPSSPLVESFAGSF